MMFLQYFVQGCYLPIASVYLQDSLGFSAQAVGLFGAALAVGPLFAPFVLGQLVDRYYPTEKVLAVSHLGGGITMLALFTQTAVWPVVILGTIYSVLYVPSMMLTNSLAFHHMRRSEREFPTVRLWGTIGFITPAYLIELWWLRGLSGDELDAGRGIAFALAGVAGLVMGAYSLTLPHTPPEQREDRKFAPGAVIGMLRDRPFLVLVVATFVISIAHKFFFVWNSPFLRAVLDSGGIEGAYEQSLSSIGQIFEVAVMAVLGIAIAKYGFRRTLLVGAGAYTLRCVLFALVFAGAAPFAARIALAGAGQALHGLCFGCFLAAGYMYVDKVSPSDIRGSMQNMYGTFVIGLGFFVGGFVSGSVGDAFTTPQGAATFRESFGVTSAAGIVEFIDKQGVVLLRDWTGIWLTCALLAGACLLFLAVALPSDRAAGVKDDRNENPLVKPPGASK